jgi:N6-adenosine-specific RNA methylase IME4
MGTQFASVIHAPVSKHSEKPEEFYGVIEAYFPNLAKIELNARAARSGWDSWGYEAPTVEAAE